MSPRRTCRNPGSYLYGAALRMYLQHHRRAGEYPADSALRKSFLSKCKIGAWSRYSNEGVQGIQQNDRPLPGSLLDLLIGRYLFTADDITLWSSDMEFYPAAPAQRTWRGDWRKPVDSNVATLRDVR